MYDFVNELLSRILTDGVNKKKWGIQQVKHSGKVNLFAGQTTEKIFIYSRGLRPGLRLCFEHVNN